MQCGFSQSSHTKAVILHVSGNSISKAWHNNKKIQEKLNKTKLKPPASSATLLGVECCWDTLALWAEKSPTNITAYCRPQLPQLGTCEMQAEHEPPLRKTNQGEGLQAHGGLWLQLQEPKLLPCRVPSKRLKPLFHVGFFIVPCVGPPGAAPGSGLGALSWEDTLCQKVVTSPLGQEICNLCRKEERGPVLSSCYLGFSGAVSPPQLYVLPPLLWGQAEPQDMSICSTSHSVGEVFIPAQTQPGSPAPVYTAVPQPRWSSSSHRLSTSILVSHILQVSTQAEMYLSCCMWEKHFLCEISLNPNTAKCWP